MVVNLLQHGCLSQHSLSNMYEDANKENKGQQFKNINFSKLLLQDFFSLLHLVGRRAV